MSAGKIGTCFGPGGKHDSFATRDAAKAWARERMHKVTGGRGKVFRCQFGDHYHVTRSICGRASVRNRRGGTK